MSAEEFWHGDPRLVVAYRQADRLRRESRYIAEWREGLYVGKAVGAVLSKEAEYPPEPLFSLMRDDDAVREQRERAKMESMLKRFGAMASSANRKMDAEKGN